MVISVDKQGVKMNNTNTIKVTWYEKTVEYAFARKFLEAAAMPLSGTAEKVGDAIFYEGNSFFIIEFKRGLNLEQERESERNKYSNLEEAIENIQEKYPACESHFVIWGYLDKKLKLELRAQTYIDFIGEGLGFEPYGEPWELNCYPCESNSLCRYFQPLDNLMQLKEYLQVLINEKKSSSKDSSSVDYGNILIVDKDGNACALSDREVLQKLELKFPTDTPSSTSSLSLSM